MVGLMADVRHFSVCTEGLSFAGVAIRLHRVVAERLWHAPTIATQQDVAFVNFEWTDFSHLHGFSQHVCLHDRREVSGHPVRITIEQEDRDTWRMRVVTECSTLQPSKFLDLFELSLD